MSFLHELSTLGRNPNVRVLNLLRDGPLGFSEILCDATSTTESALGEHLRELDRAGLVTRRVEAGPPLRVLYALTPAGARLAPALEALSAWIEASEPGAGANVVTSNYA